MPGQLKKNTSELTMTPQSLNTHLCVCVFARACQYVCVICRRDSSLHMRHDTCCWESSWEWPHLISPQDSSLAVTPVVFKRNLPGSAAVGLIPFWLRQRGWLFFFFFFFMPGVSCLHPWVMVLWTKPGDLHNSLQSLWNGEAAQVSRALWENEHV